MGYYCMQAIYPSEAPPGSGEWTWRFLATTPLWDTQPAQAGEAFLRQAARSPGCVLAWLEGVADNYAWYGHTSPWDQLAACWERQQLVGFLNLLGHELSCWGLWCCPEGLQQAWAGQKNAVLRGPATADELTAFLQAAAAMLHGSAPACEALVTRLDQWSGERLPVSLEDGLQQLGFARDGEFWWRVGCQPLLFSDGE